MGCLQSFSGGLRGSSMGSRISCGGGVCSQAKLGATRSSHGRLCLGEFHCKVCSAVRLPTSLFARIFIYQHLNLAQCKGMREMFASGTVSWTLE